MSLGLSSYFSLLIFTKEWDAPQNEESMQKKI